MTTKQGIFNLRGTAEAEIKMALMWKVYRGDPQYAGRCFRLMPTDGTKDTVVSISDIVDLLRVDALLPEPIMEGTHVV